MKQLCLLVISLLCIQAQAQLSGIYSVGGTNPDFINLVQVANALNQDGISGPVTFNIRDGAYYHSPRLYEITGSSATNTITFQSESADSSAVVLNPHNAAPNYIFRLDGTEFVTFRNLSFQASDATTGNCFLLKLGANDISFENNHFIGAPIGEMIKSFQGPNHRAKVRNNHFEGGGTAFYLAGESETDLATGTEVSGNQINGHRAAAMYMEFAEAPVIHNNTIIADLSATGTGQVSLSYCNGGLQVTNNFIEAVNSQGIFIDESDATNGNWGLIVNNFVRSNPFYSSESGISITNSNYNKLLNNTIRIGNSRQSLKVEEGVGMEIYNNILQSAGTAFYIYNTTDIEIDYNIYFSNSVFADFNNEDYSNFEDWQTDSGLDQNSLFYEVDFTMGDDFHINSAHLDGKGIFLPEVSTDLDGETRNLPPDIGADEYTPMGLDANAIAISLPAVPFIPGTHPVTLTFSNEGGETLTEINMSWTVNGVPQSDFLWTGSLASGDTTQATIGNFNFLGGMVYDIEAVLQVLGGNDPFSQNDTSRIENIQTALGGTYTIGGSNPDFENFTLANLALNYSGIYAPVIFEIRAGVYEENLVLNEIIGNDLHGITFQGIPGYPEDVTLQTMGIPVFVGTQLGEINFKHMSLDSNNPCIELDGAERMLVENCRIEATGNSKYAVNIANVTEKLDIIHTRIYAEKSLSLLGQKSAAITLSNSVITQAQIERTDSMKILHSSINKLIMDDCDYATIANNDLVGSFYDYVQLKNSLQANIYNNFIKNLSIENSDGTSLLFNSITGRFDPSLELFDSYNTALLNNILYNQSSRVCLKSNTSLNISISQFNNFYSTSVLGDLFDYPNVNTLAEWQNATGHDASSINIDPQFLNTYDLHTNLADLQVGAPLSGITTDIDGDPRDPSTPFIGADEDNPTLLPLNGIYTVGGLYPDYPTPTLAAEDLSIKGISGPVTFSIRDDEYTGPIHLGKITGTSATNTITFQSESSDSTAVTLEYNHYTGAEVVRLDSTTYVRFKGLGIVQGGGPYTFRTSGGAKHLVVENCAFIGTHNPFDIKTLFYSSNDQGGFITIRNNHFSEAKTGIDIGGTADSLKREIVIENNTFVNSTVNAIHVSRTENLRISGNSVNMIGNDNYPVSLTNCSGIFEFSNNKVIVNAYSPIQISACNFTTGNQGRFVNNYIYGRGSRIVFLDQSSNIQFYHNTVQVSEIGSANHCALFTSASSNIDLRNNNFAHLASGYLLKTDDEATFAARDFNNYFTEGNFLAINYGNNTKYNNLTELQATGNDQNSVAANPGFYGFQDYRVSSVVLNGAGISLGVSEDLDGDPRGTPPDIGADEFETLANAGKLAAITSPQSPFYGPTPVTVLLENEGQLALSSTEIQWEVNGQAQTPLSWTGNLATYAGEAVTLGDFDFQQTIKYNIKVWISNTNGMPDANPANDTIYLDDLYTTIGGAFTIGGNNPDFNTFNEAIDLMRRVGLHDAVVFNVRDGSYTEALKLGQVPYNDADNTITFQAETPNSTSVRLFFKHTFDGFVLDGADYVTFRDLKFIGLDYIVSYTEYYFPAFLLNVRNGMESLTIENCVFDGAYYGGHLILGGDVNNFVLKDSELECTGTGLYLLGDQSAPSTGIIIENNTFNSSGYYGNNDQLVLYYMENLIIHGNRFYSGEIRVAQVSGFQFTANKLRRTSLLFQECIATAGDEAVIANNFINNETRSLRLVNCNYVNVLFNNMKVNVATAFPFYNSSEFVQFKNNILANTGGGLTMSLIKALYSTDHNDFYTTGAGLISSAGTIFNTLADWQVATNNDLNSLSVDPLFVSSTDLHTTNLLLGAAGTPIAGMDTDIDDEARKATPDIGADEFITEIPYRLAIKAYLATPFVTTDELTTDLNDAGFLPLTQPYTAAPWNYPGTESLTAIPEGMVDWVLVSVRTTTDATSRLQTMAALLMSDGSILATDGQNLRLTNDLGGPGDLYIVLHHRNHLAVMTAVKVTESNRTYTHNFTQNIGYGTDAQLPLPTGEFALFPADANGDGAADAADRSAIWNDRNLLGYLDTDVTMDGVVDSEDRSNAWNNRNKSTQVP